MRRFLIIWLNASLKKSSLYKLKKWINNDVTATVVWEPFGGVLSLTFVFFGRNRSLTDARSSLHIGLVWFWNAVCIIFLQRHRILQTVMQWKMQWVSFSHLLKSALSYMSGLILLTEHTSAPTPHRVGLALDRFLLFHIFSSQLKVWNMWFAA